jgi:hypothetical protein
VDQRTIGLGALTVAILLISLSLIPRWLYPPLSAADLRSVPSAQARIQLQQAQSQLTNGARSSVLQGLAGLLVVAGALATWQRVHISREGQITDRFTRAIDQLGSENLDVRIGDIYALERIAKNSAEDRSTIQYVLAAFVRHHATWPVGAPDGPEHPTATVDTHLTWLSIRAPISIRRSPSWLAAPRHPTRGPSTYREQICAASRCQMHSWRILRYGTPTSPAPGCTEPGSSEPTSRTPICARPTSKTRTSPARTSATPTYRARSCTGPT